MSILLPDFTKGRILVIGDIMLDRYWSGSTSRISPEAPVPVVKIGDTENRLGGAANVAQNLVALGSQTSLCGIVGNDSAGNTIKSLLEQSEINELLYRSDSHPTITKLRVISQHQQLIRLDFEETLPQNNQVKLHSYIQNQLENIDVVIISDYAKGTVGDASPIIKLCREYNITVLVDPKGSDFSHYSGATIITPNRTELEQIIGKCDSIEAVFEKGQALIKRLNIEALLVTLSEKGMALIHHHTPPIHLPTQAREVFDVTGAGDTVIATFAASIAAGDNFNNAMKLSNIAAGIVVGKVGTATVTNAELESAIKSHAQDFASGSLALNKLKERVDTCRQNEEKIVFTNGCFDILHAGHVRYLKQASALGDRLIVAVNSDDSIRRLKGPERPIIPLKERMELISSLDCVDWVTSFEDDTPQEVIDTLVPDYLVKGGDYIPEKIVGYKTVTENGGNVVVMPFVDGCSTSSIIEKIKRL